MIDLQKWQVKQTGSPWIFYPVNNHLGRQGWLWSRLPITSINFVIEVEFKVGPGGASVHTSAHPLLDFGFTESLIWRRYGNLVNKGAGDTRTCIREHG